MSEFEEIDASAFEEAKNIYEKEFLFILSKIALCYKRIVQNGEDLTNNEDAIRDHIHCNYLNNQTVLNELNLLYHFECEPKEFGTSDGYLDIKIFNSNIFQNKSEYFIIECKRINNQNKRGETGLNAKYITEGIVRFVQKKYSSFHRINGMLGFVVENMNISDNITDINHLLANTFKGSNTMVLVSPIDLIEDFDQLYYSEHKDIDNADFKLFHLMLDFSNNISI